MKIELKDRIFLSNQYKILSKLNPEESSYYDNLVKILEYGYELHYNELEQNFSEEFSKQKSKFVLDILEMYSIMCLSLKNDKNINIEQNEIDFRGFDGNHEWEYINYAIYFLYDLDRYRELHKEDNYRYYNTHSRTLDKYERMLEKYKSYGNRHSLNEEEIRELINIFNNGLF